MGGGLMPNPIQSNPWFLGGLGVECSTDAPSRKKNISPPLEKFLCKPPGERGGHGLLKFATTKIYNYMLSDLEQQL